MDLMTKLTKADYDELETFLTSDETPEDCMNLSMMDGFLAAIVMGPDMILPSQWIPILFGIKEGDDVVGDTEEKMKRITSLILSHYNTLARTFKENPEEFTSILYTGIHKRKEAKIIDDWCKGFMITFGLSRASWEPLTVDPELYKLIVPIVLHGTEAGGEEIENVPELKKITQEQWAATLGFSILGINEYWKPKREVAGRERVRKVKEKINRNAPCPCGSGKKYKKCCSLKVN